MPQLNFATAKKGLFATTQSWLCITCYSHDFFKPRHFCGNSYIKIFFLGYKHRFFKKFPSGTLSLLHHSVLRSSRVFMLQYGQTESVLQLKFTASYPLPNKTRVLHMPTCTSPHSTLSRFHKPHGCPSPLGT